MPLEHSILPHRHGLYVKHQAEGTDIALELSSGFENDETLVTLGRERTWMNKEEICQLARLILWTYEERTPW